MGICVGACRAEIAIFISFVLLFLLVSVGVSKRLELVDCGCNDWLDFGKFVLLGEGR